MKLRIVGVLRNLLLVWGVFSLLAVLGLGAFISYTLGPGNRDRIDTASINDARFVLNLCGLGQDRIEKVVRSFVSSRSFTGDHLDAYAIKVTHVELAELTGTPVSFHGRWYRGDQLPAVVRDATDFIGGALNDDEIAWFPKLSELKSAGVYIYLSSTYLSDGSPTSVQLVFVRPADNMVFYFSEKT
ncbi:hypothetical protein ELE36_08495 [Pseudolysobacter antarcticus]|uniref:Uncharacterized protein n=1 Tax=Pseudolysobacter antarcticus TaxID=2511995 RepID=A0A411HIP3_9GAMM|nr:hypothetical protein [Pseudolysobacter antarcticus]QBB70402.1 hypothetical protein ELE36_08495 [Pseudolysobacter antarcticus]